MATQGDERLGVICPHCQAALPSIAARPSDILELAAEDPHQYALGPSARYPQYSDRPRVPAEAEDDDCDYEFADSDVGVGKPDGGQPAASEPHAAPPPIAARHQGSDAFELVVDRRGVGEGDFGDGGGYEIAEVEPPPVQDVRAVQPPTARQPVAPPPLPPDAAAPPAQHSQGTDSLGDPDDVEESSEQPTPRSSPEQVEEEPTFVPVVCRICRTRMYARIEQVGATIECPDCFASNVVERPIEVKKKKPQVMQGPEEDTYQISAPIERPSIETLGYKEIFDREKARRAPSTGEARRSDVEVRETAKPPKAPLSRGVFDYPLRPELRVRWIALAAGMLPILFLAKASMSLVEQGETAGVAGLLLAGVTFAIAAVWMAGASSTFLAIMQSTSEGQDDLGSTGETDWSDWFYGALYIVLALSFSVLPGWIPMQIVSAGPLLKGLVALGTGWFLFPLILMSMLENNSPMVPYSAPVWRSLNLAPGAWQTFYVETAVLAIGAYFAWFVGSYLGIVGQTIAIPLIVGAALIYFRLLGRLAWVCADLMSRDTDDDDRPNRRDEDDDEVH
jgi:hypothetical protein